MAAHPGSSISDAPAPTPPYICHDPGTPTTPPPAMPSVTAPTLPTPATTTAPDTGPNMTVHAPTDIPSPSAGQTPIVPVPASPRPEDPSGWTVDSLRREADANYDTNEIVGGPWQDTCGNSVPLRRGYYDSDLGRGRGWDKIYHYHNMKNMDVVKETIESNCGEQDANDSRGRTLIYRKEFYRQECSYLSTATLICEKKPPPVTFRAVVQMSDTLPNGQKLPGGASGVTTGYCEDTPDRKCPGWMSSPHQIDTVTGVPLNPDNGGGGNIA